MMSRFSSGVSVASLNTGIDCGPVSIASYSSVGVAPYSGGACLPLVSAPPAPTALWHMAQLVRKMSPPLAASPRAGSTCSSLGMLGPAPREATYAASWRVSSSSNWGGLASACGWLASIGIRPVATWKCTEAAPTPISDGAVPLPSAFSPWQVEQFVMNSLSPAWMSPASAVSAWARDEDTAAYTTPVNSRSSFIRTTGANRYRLPVAKAFTSTNTRITWGQIYRWWVLEQEREQVDGAEQHDPHCVHEVPVVGDDQGERRITFVEPVGGERAQQHEQESDQAAEHVQAVEPGRDEEHRAVAGVRDRQPLVHQLGVLVHLPGDEEGPHQEAEDVPLLHAPPGHLPQRPAAHLAELFSGPDTHLAGDRAEHQHQGVDRREGHVVERMALGPDLGSGHRLVGEVHREEAREEHQLRGEPDDRADLGQIRSVDRQAGCRRRRGCRRHDVIMAVLRQWWGPS